MDNPKRVFDYKPISLCNVCFKIITKLFANRLKSFFPMLVGKEQVGFVSGRCPFDNIIDIQEVVHTIENNNNDTSRMIIKLDIEKAYDTLKWSVILAIFKKMNFHNSWISWISSCLSSSSFSILVNGIPSTLFTTSRGVRQGDHVSFYLFILISQILTSTLNYGCQICIIPGFNSNINFNFNHLIYADDFILVTKTSRFVARNIKLCINIYTNFIGQHLNLTKSQIFFSSW